MKPALECGWYAQWDSIWENGFSISRQVSIANSLLVRNKTFIHFPNKEFIFWGKLLLFIAYWWFVHFSLETVEISKNLGCLAVRVTSMTDWAVLLALTDTVRCEVRRASSPPLVYLDLWQEPKGTFCRLGCVSATVLQVSTPWSPPLIGSTMFWTTLPVSCVVHKQVGDLGMEQIF